jgi:hypothetical protein
MHAGAEPVGQPLHRPPGTGGEGGTPPRPGDAAAADKADEAKAEVKPETKPAAKTTAKPATKPAG